MVRELSTGKSKTEEWMFTHPMLEIPLLLFFVYWRFRVGELIDRIYIHRNFVVMNLQSDGIWILNLASRNIFVIPIDELLKKIRLLLLTY